MNTDVPDLQVGKSFEDRVTELESQTAKFGDWTSSLGTIGKLADVKQSVLDLTDQVVAASVKLSEINLAFIGSSVEVGKLDDKVVGVREAENQVTCRAGAPVKRKQPCKELISNTKGKIVVMGDSLARGAGHKLKQQCGDVVRVDAMGGAKLWQVKDKVCDMREDKNKTVVLVAGANNMAQDSETEIVEDFLKLLGESKKVTDKIVVVGLIKRYDLGYKYEEKRRAINSQLKTECTTRDLKFIEYEPARSLLYPDGLHLTPRGQIELGKRMFEQCKGFLA